MEIKVELHLRPATVEVVVVLAVLVQMELQHQIQDQEVLEDLIPIVGLQ
jgi:hypothetical protein